MPKICALLSSYWLFFSPCISVLFIKKNFFVNKISFEMLKYKKKSLSERKIIITPVMKILEMKGFILWKDQSLTKAANVRWWDFVIKLLISWPIRRLLGMCDLTCLLFTNQWDKIWLCSWKKFWKQIKIYKLSIVISQRIVEMSEAVLHFKPD